MSIDLDEFLRIRKEEKLKEHGADDFLINYAGKRIDIIDIEPKEDGLVVVISENERRKRLWTDSKVLRGSVVELMDKIERAKRIFGTARMTVKLKTSKEGRKYLILD